MTTEEILEIIGKNEKLPYDRPDNENARLALERIKARNFFRARLRKLIESKEDIDI